eukprot:CAMPEP_0172471114 /NCGR_PEP_ID=MMETSP1065-20121228/67650_1 /TAXON_ID=265537 /ORGANISM="Amphiprora paludosa, Strain CCMP125" /LENGTH=306 /DNA_ID=CAMNT_0013229201 /DNA_START=53 /DNA_END=973 /DNA_ORIENTATION=-
MVTKDRSLALVLAAGAGVLAAGAAAFYFMKSGKDEGSKKAPSNGEKVQQSDITSRSIDFSAVVTTDVKSNGDAEKASGANGANATSGEKEEPVAVNVESDDAAISTEAKLNGSENGTTTENENTTDEAREVSSADKVGKEQTPGTPATAPSTSDDAAISTEAKLNGSENGTTTENENTTDEARVSSADKVSEDKTRDSKSVLESSPITDDETEKKFPKQGDKLDSNPPMTPDRKVGKEQTPGTPATAPSTPINGDEHPDIAALARAHAHHKKKPNHTPSKNSAAAKAIKELQASNNKKKKKKKNRN